MTLRGPSARDAFRNAGAYEATMAPSLRNMAFGVTYRAALGPGERVLDVGCGTGIGAEAAIGDGRAVVGLDVSAEMLEIARARLPNVRFVEGDFSAMPFEDGSFDVLISVHALLFAGDPVAALREWRRVTRAGGRLSLSVPGPADRTPSSIYADTYERHGVGTQRADAYPTQASLKGWALEAGWSSVATDADPRTIIKLPDAAAFDVWMSVGARGVVLRDRAADERSALATDLLAVTPRGRDGSLQIPFGTLYLTARA